MADETSGSAAPRASLPDAPSLEWLRKQAKQRLAQLRATIGDAQLADAQFALAREYGFPSWRALKAHIDTLTIDGRLFDAARRGDVTSLGKLLDAHPDRLQARMPPYEMSLLHLAAQNGHVAAVNLLLERGLDVNTREKGDNTYPMHWAAAAGRLDLVRRLADAGGDVIGKGDDHELAVIGWASCWEGQTDAAHRAVVDELVRRGARHHIFSAIALSLGDEVRRLVAADAAVLNQRMSRNEGNATPLHFAVKMGRPEMVALLVDLGADPLAVDASGYAAATYATSPEIDRPIMERIHAMTAAEILSAERGSRTTRAGMLDLLAALSLRDWDTAARLVRDSPTLLGDGVLHLAAKRGDVAAARWLLEHGAAPNALWPHWDADVTPLHLTAFDGQLEVARLLLASGADATIHDSKHDGSAIDWAEFFKRPALAQLLREETARQGRNAR
jgi:ankyrin repeat protein